MLNSWICDQTSIVPYTITIESVYEHIQSSMPLFIWSSTIWDKNIYIAYI